MADWYQWLKDVFIDVAEYAVKNPYDFYGYIMLIISPMLLICLVLSYLLLKEMDKKEKRLKNPTGSKRSIKAMNRVRTDKAKKNK